MSVFRPELPLREPTSRAGHAHPAASSAWLWMLLYLGTLAVVAARLPARIESAERTLPSDLRKDVGNEQLTETAIRAGAYLGLLLFAIALLLVVLAVRYYERQLGGTRAFLPETPLAMGPCWVAAATGRLADQALSTGLLSWGTLAAFALSTGLTCALYLRRTSPAGLRRAALAIAMSSALTVLS